MIVFRNLNLVKNSGQERLDIARQLNLTIGNASSLALILNTRKDIREFALGISSYAQLDDYVLAGQYLIDDIDLANPLTLKNRHQIEMQVQVLAPYFFDVFQTSKKVRSVLKFLLKQHNAPIPETLVDSLRFVELDEDILDFRIGEISNSDRVKMLLLLATLTQARFMIFEELDIYLDDAELHQILKIINQHQINTGASCLFLTTDMNWGLENSDAVGVLHGGLLLENGSSAELSRRSLHPMTLAIIRNQYPETLSPIGCPYATWCHAKSRVSENLCTTSVPVLVSITDSHMLRCHLSAEERTAYYNEVNHADD